METGEGVNTDYWCDQRLIPFDDSPSQFPLGLSPPILLFVPGRGDGSPSLLRNWQPLGPFNVETYEPADYRNAYARTIELPVTTSSSRSTPSFALPALETGNRAAGSARPGRLYPACPAQGDRLDRERLGAGQLRPSRAVRRGGPTLIFARLRLRNNAGHLRHAERLRRTEPRPGDDRRALRVQHRARRANPRRKVEPAPEFRPIVGNRDPAVIEDWYYALWGYNGFAFKNHPLADKHLAESAL